MEEVSDTYRPSNKNFKHTDTSMLIYSCTLKGYTVAMELTHAVAVATLQLTTKLHVEATVQHGVYAHANAQ